MRWVCSLLIGLLASMDASAKLYKWVDAQGRVHYSDTLPESRMATRGASELSSRAIVVKEAESPEQRAARLANEEKRKAEELQRQEKERRDRALLESFVNPEEIDRIRDRNLEQVEGAISAHLALRKAAEARRQSYKKQAAHFQNLKKPLPPDLALDIRSTEQEIAQIDKQIGKRQQEKTAIIAKAEEDKKRLVELKNR